MLQIKNWVKSSDSFITFHEDIENSLDLKREYQRLVKTLLVVTVNGNEILNAFSFLLTPHLIVVARFFLSCLLITKRNLSHTLQYNFSRMEPLINGHSYFMLPERSNRIWPCTRERHMLRRNIIIHFSFFIIEEKRRRKKCSLKVKAKS